MKQLFMMSLLLALSSIPLTADTSVDKFSAANLLYQNSRYAEAVDAYKTVAAEGNVNADVYYNLGNAYYKNQQPGFALAYYEKALRLNPRNSDIKSNISFVNSTLRVPDNNLFEMVIEFFEYLLTINESAVISSFFLILLMTGLSIYLFRKSQQLLFINLVTTICFLCSLGLFMIKYQNEIRTISAIVVKGPSEVRNGPGTENSVGFTLPEGRKVEILGQKDNWYAVGIKEEGLKGWIEKNAVEPVNL